MHSNSHDPILEFLSKFTNPKILRAVMEHQDTAMLAEVLKRHVYQNCWSLDEAGRDFMLAVMEMVDWSLLARRVLDRWVP